MTDHASDSAPLIVTARLPDDLHRWATGLRDAHFPPERNHLEAHVTLFHALPPFVLPELNDLTGRMAKDFAPVPGRIEGLVSLGRGTAIRLASPQMLALRQAIANAFQGLLTAQDTHTPRLHITIQNKVLPHEAKALMAALAGQVPPRPFAFKGIELFRYRGGPWDLVKQSSFRGTGAP